jgi:HEPN domain-containing protein
MTPKGSGPAASIFLKKATWYLESAVANLESGRYNPAVSDAVISGVNSSDVICIAGGGSYAVTAEHSGALRQLQRSGELGQRAVPLLQALLPQKNLSQYRNLLNSHQEAQDAMDAAEELLELAREAAASQRR